MGHSYIYSRYHVVFSTEGRRRLLTPDFRPRLFAYMAAIANNHGYRIIASGGIENHVHLLVALPADQAISDAVGTIKANSSRWHREHDRHFGWQEGYGAFTVSKSTEDDVIHYIEHQEEHHHRQTFEDEYIALLNKHGIEFDPAYVFG